MHGTLEEHRANKVRKIIELAKLVVAVVLRLTVLGWNLGGARRKQVRLGEQ